MSFFTTHIADIQPQHFTVQVSWPEIPKDGYKVGVVENCEQLIRFVGMAQSEALRNITCRYIDQRYKALATSKSNKLPAAGTLNSQLPKFRKDCFEQGMICLWIKQRQKQLDTILPGEDSIQHRWREVIPGLLEYAMEYYPGKSRQNCIEIFNTNIHTYEHTN